MNLADVKFCFETAFDGVEKVEDEDSNDAFGPSADFNVTFAGADDDTGIYVERTSTDAANTENALITLSEGLG